MGKLKITGYALCSRHHVKCWESRDEQGSCPVLQLVNVPPISLIKRLKLSLLHCRGPLGAWTPAGSRVLKLVGQKQSENAPDHPVTC